MADWRDAYKHGDEIDAKLGNRWLPGTVDKKVGDFALSCKLEAGDLLIDSPDRIRKRANAAQPAAKPAAKAAEAAAPPAKPKPRDNKGPPA